MVQMNLPHWRKHGFPVVVTSPEDSRCVVPGVDCVFHGLNDYTGIRSLNRWRLMLGWMAQQPFDYFMMHEADSICLNTDIPRYCYRQGVLFSNEMPDNAVPPTQAFYSLAPWFMSKSVIVRMLEVSKTRPDRPPYHGDRWVGQMVEQGAIAHQKFEPGIGCGTLSFSRPAELEQVCSAIRAGACMIHGIKTPDVLEHILKVKNRR